MELGLALLRVALTALLYVFLAAILWLLWRDLRHSATRRTLPRPEARLVLVEPAETGLEVDVSFPLQEVTSLGRTAANTIVLRDPFVSSHHALVAWREARWWVEDLESRNGTTLNGEPATRPVVVSAGDLIGVGRVILRLESES